MIKESCTSWDCLNGEERQIVLNIAEQYPLTIEEVAGIFLDCNRDELKTHEDILINKFCLCYERIMSSKEIK